MVLEASHGHESSHDSQALPLRSLALLPRLDYPDGRMMNSLPLSDVSPLPLGSPLFTLSPKWCVPVPTISCLMGTSHDRPRRKHRKLTTKGEGWRGCEGYRGGRREGQG